MNTENIIALIEKQIPSEAQIIYNVLSNKGFDVFFVGGAIRDILMSDIHGINKKIKDWDITTTARYGDLEQYFNKILKVNERGMIVSKIGRVELLIPHLETTAVCINNRRFEVTPLSTREQESVLFTSNLCSDLYERDFTINAMAYSKKHGLMFEYNNRENGIINCIDDVRDKVIRCTSDPRISIDKNYFIMLRAARLAISLGFSIETGTFEAIREKSEYVNGINKGKVYTEFEKILLCDNFFNMDYLFSLGIVGVLCPEWDSSLNEELKDTFVAMQDEEKNVFKRIKFLYDTFGDKEQIECFLHSFGVNKDTIIRIKEIYLRK